MAGVLAFAATQLFAQGGDPAKGKELVAANGCTRCHRIGDTGSRVGPNLTDIGDRRTPDRLETSILQPDDEVLPENRFVLVTMKDGTTVRGRLLNHDAISVQLMDGKEQPPLYRGKGYARLYDPDQGSDAVVCRQAFGRSGEGHRRLPQLPERIRLMRAARLLPLALVAAFLPAQVSSDRILHADSEPQNWLTYGGGYASNRYSLLTKLNRDNVKDLKLKWVWRPRYFEKMEATPLVVDGVLYTVQNSDAVAMDAATGRIYWTFHYNVPPESNQYLMVVKGSGYLR